MESEALQGITHIKPFNTREYRPYFLQDAYVFSTATVTLIH